MVKEIFDPEAIEVEAMECEWKPGTNVLDDRTAFDAVVVTKRTGGERHLIGIETKYTEALSSKQYPQGLVRVGAARARLVP